MEHQTDLDRFCSYWLHHRDMLIERILNNVVDSVHPLSGPEEREMLRTVMVHVTSCWIEALRTNDMRHLTTGQLSSDAQRMIAASYSFEQVMASMDLVREQVLGLLRMFCGDQLVDGEILMRLESILHVQGSLLGIAYHENWKNTTSQLSEQVRNQYSLIRDLSTPIVPIYQGVLVLPLIGNVDSYRANHITEALLNGIVAAHADVVIIDITGISDIDSTVLNYVIQTSKAVRMVGATMIVCGIGATIAQKIVALDITLGDLVTRANLQSSLEYALRLRGYTICSLPG